MLLFARMERVVKDMLTAPIASESADAVAGYAIVTAVLDIDDCLGTNLRPAKKQFRTNCEILVTFGEHTAKLPQGYEWNGADIPRVAWILLGLSPTDRRLALASGFHDRGCERPNIPQVIADATYVALCRPVVFNGETLAGVGEWQAIAMYLGIRAWSVWRAVRNRIRKTMSARKIDITGNLFCCCILAAAVIVAVSILGCPEQPEPTQVLPAPGERSLLLEDE